MDTKAHGEMIAFGDNIRIERMVVQPENMSPETFDGRWRLYQKRKCGKDEHTDGEIWDQIAEGPKKQMEIQAKKLMEK